MPLHLPPHGHAPDPDDEGQSAAPPPGIVRTSGTAAGTTRWSVDRAVASGSWVRPERGVLLQREGEPDAVERLWVALVRSGPDAVLTGAVGCRLHRVPYVPEVDRVCVLITLARRPEPPPWVCLHRSDRPLRRTTVAGLPVADCARSVADECLHAHDLRTARALACGAVQRRLTSGIALRQEYEDGPRRGSAYLRRAVADVAAGAWSAPEAEAADLLTPGRRVTLHRNCVLHRPDGTRVARPDLHLLGTGVVGQVQSKEFHAGGEGFDDAVGADARLAAAAYAVLPMTPWQVRSQPQLVRQQWRELVAGRRGAGLGDPPGYCVLLDGTRVPHR